MALSVVGTPASYDNGGSTWISTTLTQPAGVASGDFGLVGFSWFENVSGTEALLTPSGHTSRTTTVFGSGSFESILSLYTADYSAAPGNLFVSRDTVSMFASVVWPVFRGSSALTFASIGTVQAPDSTVTSISAPSVSGTSGQGLLAIYALDDPGSSFSQSEGMTLAVASPLNTMNIRVYYETLSSTGATGTRTLTWTTARKAAAVLMLIDGADSGGSPKGRMMMLGIG